MSEDAPQMRLSEMFDKAYYEPWATKKKNVVIKGSKGSGKSKWAALWIIYNMMKYRDLMPSTLVVRKFKESIKDSIYAELKWAINQFHVESLWKCNISPMEMVFLPTGQKILFRGMDNPLKVASISVEKGSLCWVLWEEASQITNEEDFNTINMSIRGKLPPGLWKRVMIIFNPWSEKHWLKARFFDNPDPDTLALTTTYKNNPFLSEENLKEYEDLRIRSPRAARVICDGDWGIAGGLVFEDWEEADFDINVIRATYPGLRFSYGLDFGFVNDPTAFVAIAVDELSRQIWIFDEMYEYGWDNLKIARKLTRMGYADKVIVCDSAEQKSIYELKRGYQTPAYDDNGDPLMDVDGHQLTDTWILPNAEMAMKGPDSVRNGIRDLQSYHIIIHRTKCKNAIIEFNNYAFEEDKDGNLTDKPMDVFNHCLAAGTMIATDHGNVPIEDVQVGDMVLTHLGYRKVLASGITRPEPAEIWRIETEGGNILEGTFDHPLPRNPDHPCHEDVLPLGHSAGSMIRIVGGGRDCVMSAIPAGRVEYVYDLTVDEAHDFFANGILVSNCMDSLRYAKSKLMGKGKGLVIETGESPVITSTEPHTIKRLQPCSRVYSTYDDESRLLSGPTTSDGIPLSLFNQASQKEAER